MPDNSQLNLASWKGKVVVLEFLLTTCPACQRCAQAMNKIQAEYGKKGVQVIGIAVDDPGAKTNAVSFVSRFGLGFPVGYLTGDKPRDFLQIPSIVRFMLPQVVFIDRQGTIVAQHNPSSPFFANEEKYAREQLDKLLAAPAGGAAKKAPAKSGAKKK